MSQNSFLLNVRGVSYKPTVCFFKTNRTYHYNQPCISHKQYGNLYANARSFIRNYAYKYRISLFSRSTFFHSQKVGNSRIKERMTICRSI